MYNSGYTKVDNNIFTVLTKAEHLLTYIALKRFVYGEKNICNPSISTLSNVTKLSVRTIIRSIKDLEALGIVIKIQRRNQGKRSYRSNEYTLPYEGDFDTLCQRDTTLCQRDTTPYVRETQASVTETQACVTETQALMSQRHTNNTTSINNSFNNKENNYIQDDTNWQDKLNPNTLNMINKKYTKKIITDAYKYINTIQNQDKIQNFNAFLPYICSLIQNKRVQGQAKERICKPFQEREYPPEFYESLYEDL